MIDVSADIARSLGWNAAGFMGAVALTILGCGSFALCGTIARAIDPSWYVVG